MNISFSTKKLKRNFYTRDVLTVARELPGNILVRKTGRSIYSGRIVEVEAYDGSVDEAAHSFKGRTTRTEVMFGPGGFLYVYFTYGMHHCCNVVTGHTGSGSAVLIRGIEPVTSIEKMAYNRFGRNLLNEREKYNLTSGPAKVCEAFNISKTNNGTDLTGDEIYILAGELLPGEKIVTSKRIGITRSVDLLWRFFIKDNMYVSRK